MFLKTQSPCVCKLTLHLLTGAGSIRWKVDGKWRKYAKEGDTRKDESVYGSPLLSVIKPVIRKWQNTDPFLYKLKAISVFWYSSPPDASLRSHGCPVLLQP